LDTQELWSHITIKASQPPAKDNSVPDRPTKRVEEYGKLFNLIVQKAGLAKLDICIQMRPNCSYIAEIMRFLPSLSSRWSRLVFSAGSQFRCFRSFAQIRDLSALESFEIEDLDDHLDHNEDLEILKRILAAPRLQSVYSAHDFEDNTSLLPIGNLVRRHKTWAEWSDLQAYLRSDSFHASWLRVSLLGDLLPCDSPVLLLGLHDFEWYGLTQVNGDAGATLDGAFKAFRVPDLCRLSMEAQEDSLRPSFPLSSFRHFLLQSRCKLTSLRIDNITFSNKDLVSACYLLPSLLQMTYSEDNGDELVPAAPGLIHELARCPRFLPSLEVLDLTVCCKGLDDSTIVDAYTRRAFAALRRMNVVMRDREYNPAVLQGIRHVRTSSHAEIKGSSGNIICSCTGAFEVD
jgi:hypothetical protein